MPRSAGRGSEQRIERIMTMTERSFETTAERVTPVSSLAGRVSGRAALAAGVAGSNEESRRIASRGDRFVGALVPAVLAVLAAAIVLSQQPQLGLVMALVGLVLVGWGILRQQGPLAADVIVLVGRGPMASVIASSLVADSPSRNRTHLRLLRAVTVTEAITLLRSARCDEIIMAGSVGPFPVDFRDSRGLRPIIINGAEKIETLLGRVPLEIAAQDRWFSRLGSIRPLGAGYGACKRLLDVTVACALGILLLPLLPLLALAIKLDSPGPVFYSQRRVGLGGGMFDILKFRTMRQDAERDGAVWAQSGDPRITRVGRFMRRTRFDELPQIVNVLRGEMTLVGPRPERPEFTVTLAKELPGYDLRHTVKPGLTGWAQVCYRYTNTIRDTKAKVEYDLFYVKHQSLKMDLRILVRTVKVVLGREGM